MKYIIYLFLALFTHVLSAQNIKDFSSAKLISGYPQEAAFAVKDYGFTDFTQTTLVTGVDSFQVKLGSYMDQGTKGYYSVIYYGKKYGFKGIDIKSTNSLAAVSDTLVFNLNEFMSVSVRTRYDSSTNQIFYKWIDRGAGSKIANIVADGLIQPNKPMPDFAFYDLENKKGALSDFKGKYVVINWWSTGCGPCIAEMPILNKMVERYKFRKDVVFLAVAWNDKEQLRSFLPKRAFTYQQAYNKDLIKLFGNGFPRHVIVSPEGIVTEVLSAVTIDKNNKITEHLEIEEAVKRQLEGK